MKQDGAVRYKSSPHASQQANKLFSAVVRKTRDSWHDGGADFFIITM